MDTKHAKSTDADGPETPEFFYLATPAGFPSRGTHSPERETELQLGRHMREEHPVVHSHEDEAEEEAQIAASSADDLQAWAQEAGRAAGMTDDELEELGTTVLPRAYAYVIKIKFYSVRVDRLKEGQDWTSLIGKTDLVLLPDALVLGSGDGQPRARFRIVTNRELVGDFAVIKKTKMFVRPRPRL